MERINDAARVANPSNRRELVGGKGARAVGPGGPRVGTLAPTGVADYLESLTHPRAKHGVRIPGAINGRAAMASMTSQTTATMNVSVTANTTTQLALSGHGPYVGVDEMANHGSRSTIHTTGYVFGPYSDQTYACAAGVRSTGVTLGTWQSNITSTAAAANAPILWDVQFPISNTADNSDFQRYRMVSCEVTWQSTTEELNRGGSVVTVQPQHDANIAVGADQGEFARYPTYFIHDVESGSVTTLPASEDLAYWHNDVSAAATTAAGSGLYMWLNAPAGAAQTYIVSVTCNWELAGDNLESLSEPALNVPGAIDSIVDTVDAMRNAGIPGAEKTLKCDHCVRAAAMPEATRAIHGLPETSDGVFDMAKKLVGDIAPGLLMALL
jgi:hypothetical protein